MRPLIALLLLASLGACDRQKAPEPQAQPTAPIPATSVDYSHKGKAMPAMPFQDATEAPATLTGFRGKPLLVNLWATWCVPCVAEMPKLDALAKAEAARLNVVAVSQDMEGRRVVQPFFAKRGFIALKPYLDRTNALMLALDEASLPVTVFYGADGKERWRVRGGMDWTGAQAKALLAEGLAG